MKQISEVVGGLSETIWGKQYHQQDRVYDVADIAQCIPAQIPGGGYRILEIKEVKDEPRKAKYDRKPL